MVKEYDLPTAKELCAKIEFLKDKVGRLQETIDFLEAEVIAIGNVLIKHNVLTLKEIETFTSVAINQKIAEKNSRSPNASEELRQEFQEALQEKIKQ